MLPVTAFFLLTAIIFNTASVLPESKRTDEGTCVILLVVFVFAFTFGNFFFFFLAVILYLSNFSAFSSSALVFNLQKKHDPLLIQRFTRLWPLKALYTTNRGHSIHTLMVRADLLLSGPLTLYLLIHSRPQHRINGNRVCQVWVLMPE